MLYNAFYTALSFLPWVSLLIAGLLLLRRTKKPVAAGFFRAAWLVLSLRCALPFRLRLPRLEQVAPSVQLQLPIAGSAAPPVAYVAPAATPAALVTLPAPTPAALSLGSILALLAVIWAAGALLFFCWRLACWLRLAGALVHSRTSVTDENILSQTAAAFGRPMRVFLTDALFSPALFGLFRPVLYLNKASLAADVLPMVLAHEACHHRRGDLPFKWLLCLAQAVCWPDPLVHLMARAAAEDIERACDEAVTAGQDISFRQRYGAAILQVLQAAQNGRRCGLSTEFSASPEQVKARFAAIFDRRPRRRLLPLLALLTLLTLAGGTLVSCRAQEESPSAPPVTVLPKAESSSSQTESAPAPFAVPFDDYDGLFTFPLSADDYRHIARRFAEGTHTGIDLAAENGAPILAVWDGTVVRALETQTGYGIYCAIDHGNGLTSWYTHCSALAVTEGQQVSAGDVIAFVGNTGNSTGPHLHFEVRREDKPLEPMNFFGETGLDLTPSQNGEELCGLPTDEANCILIDPDPHDDPKSAFFIPADSTP